MKAAETLIARNRKYLIVCGNSLVMAGSPLSDNNFFVFQFFMFDKSTGTC